MKYVMDNLNKFSAVEIAGAAGILNCLNLLADTVGQGKSGFAESLGVLFDIHMAAARLGLINKNLDADPYGMFRTEGDIREITKDQVFLGGVHGRNTHSMTEWIKLDKEGRLTDEDRAVILRHYSSHLDSNFEAIGRELIRHRTIAREEMNDLRDKSRLARLFTRRQYPVCVFPEGFNPKTATKESYRKMAAQVFADKAGAKVPTLTIPETVLDARMPFLAENPFIKVRGSVTKDFAKDLAMEIQSGGDRFDHKDCREWLYGISKDDLQAFRNMVESYATQLHPDGNSKENKDWVRGQLDGWLAGVVTKEDQIAHNEEIKGLDNEFRTIQKTYALAEKTDRLVSGEFAKDFSGPVVWSRELPMMIPDHPEILGVAFMDYKDCTNVHVLTDDGECRLMEEQSKDTILAVAKECERLLEEKMGNKVPSHNHIEQKVFLNTLQGLSPEALKQMANEPGASDFIEQLEGGPKQDPEAAKQRLREDIDFECRQVLRLLFERDPVGQMKAPAFGPAQDLDGNLFQGFNAARLTAQLAAHASATTVFVSEKDITALGVSVSPNEKDRFCTLEDGTRVWNLDQTSYRRQHPEHFRAIESACQAPSMDDDTFIKMRRFWAETLELGGGNISESDYQLKMKGFLHDYHNELSGTVIEASKKSMIADGVASLSLVSKMRYEPGVGELPDKKMQFAEIDEVYSFRKGAPMYPAYETMMEAGKRVAAVESAFPTFKERQGIDVNAVINHVNANIRIRNERHLAEAETQSNGMRR